jgi:hypothetical protein
MPFFRTAFLVRRVLGLAALLLALLSTSAPAQNWPVFYDPFVVRDIHLTMNSTDWNTVRNDLTFNQEVPAYLSLPGETPVLVALRRKSSIALPSEGNAQKVGLKIDVNEFVPGQSWHALKKLSLENGADTSVLLEGFAWYLHRLAWAPGGYPYMPGLACWSRVFINGSYLGLYVNVEQVDKRFCENRGIWLDDDTWLYKSSDVGPPTLEFGGPTNSPACTTLCYSPFVSSCSPSCSTPPPATLATQLPTQVNMQGMLTLGAVNNWSYSPDNLFSKGKNFFFSDHRYDLRRFFSWDMDANFGSLNTNKSIYEVGMSPYEDIILDNPTFRQQYDNIMRWLINGPLATANLTAALNTLEPILTPAWQSDPYGPPEGGAASQFASLRNFISSRNAFVASELPPTTAVGDEVREPHASLTAQPNPFRASTRLAFELERPGAVEMSIYDMRGARVRTLVDAPYPSGLHQTVWDGADDQGRRLSSGLYFVRVETEGKSRSKGVVLLQ